MWELGYKESWVQINWCFWTVVLEKTLESPLDFKEIQPVHPKRNQSWIFFGRTYADTLVTWCEELTHWKRPWCWKRLKAGREGDDRGWDCWMASPSWWTWVWASSGSWWWTGKPVHGVSQSQTWLSDWTRSPKNGHWPLEELVATRGTPIHGVGIFSCIPPTLSPREGRQDGGCVQLPMASDSSARKESSSNAGDTGDKGLIPGLGRRPGRENGNPFQYSCLKDPVDREVWRATVLGVTASWTWLSDSCSSQWFNQSCLCNEASIKAQPVRFGELPG